MRFGSLFSGIEAASVAWHPLGWETAFVADVDPFACAHLSHRLPDVPNLGDVSAEDFVARARACGPIDVLVGGSPCQAFSFAGRRRSLDDERGNLMLRFTEISDELDPDCICWENVPGVLSTKDNAFGCLLAALAGESKVRWSAQGVNGRTQVILLDRAAQSHGAFSTLNFSSWHNAGAACSLLHVLEEDVPETYSLSTTARDGIQHRSAIRGKRLPDILKDALSA